jgi:hypothetical protein
MGKRWLTSRCSRRGCRESFKRQFSFAVVGLVIVIGASACLGKTRFSSSQELICDSVSYAEALDK